MGYPSWKDLAKRIYENLTTMGCISDPKSYEKYLENKEYPELFRQAERDLGNREQLVHYVNQLLTSNEQKPGTLYELISKWPFACYLTTNYDDEIANHLSSSSDYFQVIRNRQEDFYSWQDGANHLIQKLHSDLDNPDEVILTSSDFRRFYVDNAGQYFRDGLCGIFKMFDVFIIGHSLSDPDIDYVLQLAKEGRSPHRPIYMASADVTKAEEKEFYEKFNIELVGYANTDGTHSELLRMLKTVDRFIVSRDHSVRERNGLSLGSTEEVESAIALFLYRRLQGVHATDYVSPLILSGLNKIQPNSIHIEQISTLPIVSGVLRESDNADVIYLVTSKLIQEGLVSEENRQIKITESGCSRVLEFQSIRKTEMDQAYGQFRFDLKNNYEIISDTHMTQCQKLAEEVIVASFANRGLVIANNVFSGQSARPHELSDVFADVSNKASEIENVDVRTAFIAAMHQYIVKPNSPQRRYLASVSQGYFLFHSLGLDPRFREEKKDIFNRTVWLCDSSVILPLLAVGCQNFEYAEELFRELVDENAKLYTTQNLLKEAWDHFNWALKFMNATGTESLEFLRAALVMGSYKQNLFLDGFIRMSADGKVNTFRDYIELVITSENVDQFSFYRTVAQFGIEEINISDLDGFVEGDWGDLEWAKAKIKKVREERGNYRSSLQVESEAEVWMLLSHLQSGRYTTLGLEDVERVYFLSQGRILDHVFNPQDFSTWTPEALYRYLSTLPNRELNPDLLQQCMLQEYYYAGISLIDRARYERFFGPNIDAAKACYKTEKDGYIKELESKHIVDIDSDFKKTPDLEKPFFVAHMGWHLAELSQQREKTAVERAVVAEKKVERLEAEKDIAWKKRNTTIHEQEIARLRNLNDPKHVRKRKRQAKKRRRKNK